MQIWQLGEGTSHTWETANSKASRWQHTGQSEDPGGSQCGVRGGVADEVNEVEGRGKTWLDKTGTWRPLLGLGIFCLERIPMQAHLH